MKRKISAVDGERGGKTESLARDRQRRTSHSYTIPTKGTAGSSLSNDAALWSKFARSGGKRKRTFFWWEESR